jgi:DNA-binding LacI/PurR family transcriptional regulator
MLHVLERLEEPLILVQEFLPLAGRDRMTIRQDDYGGAHLLAEHLLARGVRRAAVIAPRFGGPMTNARMAGFQAALMKGDTDFDLATVTADQNTFAGGIAAMERYLADNAAPGAVIGVNDELALAGIRALQERNLRVPDDVMVTGFNGFEPSSYYRPSLTTVESPAARIGEEAGRMLMRRLVGGSDFPTQDYVLPVTFRKGESTG